VRTPPLLQQRSVALSNSSSIDLLQQAQLGMGTHLLKLLPVQHNAKSPNPNRADSLVAKGTDSNSSCMLWCMTATCQDRGGRTPFIKTAGAAPRSTQATSCLPSALRLEAQTNQGLHTHKQANKNINKIQHHSAHTGCVCLQQSFEGRSQQLSTAWGLHTCLLTAQHALQVDGPPKMQAQQMHLPIYVEGGGCKQES